MTKRRLRIPLLILVAGVTCFGAALIHVTGDPERVGRQLGSEVVGAAIGKAVPTAACDHNGKVTNGALNCADYRWRDELRYRVVRDGSVRIFTMTDAARPRLSAEVTSDGAGHVSAGSARATAEFMFDILLGIVTTSG
jgi:hypothetical protein